MERSDSPHWYRGSATAGGRGWFVGPYRAGINPLLHGDGIQVKWGAHPAGEERADWDGGVAEWSLCLLISGDLTLLFADGCERLSEQGDFVIWAPDTRHKWRSNSDSVIVTIRWAGTNTSA
jgi:hypothetical protein